MTTAITTTDAIGQRLEEVMVLGNLSALTPIERTEYYRRLCNTLGLEPLTQPLTYLTLNGKLVLYANRAAAEQLRKVHGVSISPPQIEYADDLVIVTVTATDATGRQDSDMGVVALGKLTGEARANAILKAVTKAKRRVTLSICGLGMLDESEVEDIPDSAKRPPVQMPQARPALGRQAQKEPPFGTDAETGEMRDVTPPVDWASFWKNTAALGFTEPQVRDFVNAPKAEFDAFSNDDLIRLYADLADAAAGVQPALT